jgi:hypothetical protein
LKYLCLVYLNEKAFHALSREELDALDSEVLDYDDALGRSGHYIA